MTASRRDFLPKPERARSEPFSVEPGALFSQRRRAHQTPRQKNDNPSAYASDRTAPDHTNLLRIYAHYPQRIASRAAHRFEEVRWLEDPDEAYRWLRRFLDPIEGIDPIRLATTTPEIRQLARNASGHALCTLPGLAQPLLGATISRLCRKYAVSKPPVISGPSVKRMQDMRWWTRRIRAEHGRHLEAASTLVNLVNRHDGRYASDEAVARRRENLTRSRDMMEAIYAVNEIGQEFSLAELREHSISAPQNRRAELMARISGLEQAALSLGYAAEFYSITCPGRMHSSLHRSGEPNPRHDGTSPAAAHKYLMKQWQKIRAKLNRDRIEYFGFRVSEPQHDGTPHLHLLLFVNPAHIQALHETCRRYSLQVDPDEAGASRYRFKAVSIDPAKGSATGYIAKYISKNIDGYGLAKDGANGDEQRGTLRVDAWASTWRIRQFQQIGGPPVGPYRELRRLKGQLVGDPILDAGIAAADNGDWDAYCSAQGPICSAQADRPIRIARVWSDQPGVYGDPKGYRTIGIECSGVTVPTRFHTWTINPSRSGEKGTLYAGKPAVRAEGGAALPGAARRGWSAVGTAGRGTGSSGPLEFCQ